MQHSWRHDNLYYHFAVTSDLRDARLTSLGLEISTSASRFAEKADRQNWNPQRGSARFYVGGDNIAIDFLNRSADRSKAELVGYAQPVKGDEYKQFSYSFDLIENVAIALDQLWEGHDQLSRLANQKSGSPDIPYLIREASKNSIPSGPLAFLEGMSWDKPPIE